MPDPDLELDHAMQAALLRIGRVVDNKYRLISVIGIGGMGIVYEAEHQFLGRIVALKILHPRYTDRFEEFQRFLREARAAGAIGHRSIVEVFDAGSLDGTTPYLVMERLVGENLEQQIRRKTTLSVRRTFRIAHEVLKGLEAAHTKRILHCDMKPANVFLVRGHTRPGMVKLLDFGISRMGVEDSVPALDEPTGYVFGTPQYMAPEQVLGGALDARTDLYAVGAMLFEALTGGLPFAADTRKVVFRKIVREPVPPLPPRSDLAPELAQLVLALLEKKPENRPRTAAEVLRIIVASGVAVFENRADSEPE